jgi:guanosine-3',5'-bis(diphosphate) 3'-pyrophosphohydrolase
VLARVGGVTDRATLLGAILHDTVEDTDTALTDIERAFGAEVRQVVAEVTDDKRLPKAERKRRQVQHAPHASEAARLVKLADKICNVRDVTDSPPATWTDVERRAYLDWSAEVVAGCRGLNAALERHFDEVLADGRARLAAG